MTEILIHSPFGSAAKIISAHVEEEKNPILRSKPSWFKIKNLIIFVMILAALPVTVFLVQQQQELRKKAVETSSAYPLSVPVLSLHFFPTTPCYNPLQKINLGNATASSNATAVEPVTEPKYAIDGLTNTKWMPNSPHKGTYFLLDLGSLQTFKDISSIFWATDRPQEYHLDVSPTGSFSGEQTRVVTETNSLNGYYQIPGTSFERKDYVFTPIQARYIKLTIDAYRTGSTSEGQVNLYEFEVYAEVEEKKCLDKVATGEVNVNSNPLMSDPLSEIRNRVTSHNQNIIQTIKEGSRFHAYKDAAAIPSLQHSILEDKEYLEAIPASTTWPRFPDYLKILNDLGICNYVDNVGVKEVFMWGYHTSQIIPIETNMAMGTISQDFWNETNKFEVKQGARYGDISNSAQVQDLPICSKTYVVYNFVYGPSYVAAIHDYLHQIENELGFADREMFWDIFTGRQYQFAGPRRCGNSHAPPNTTLDYGYSEQTSESSDCEDWLPVNCTSLQKEDPCGGTRQTFNCTKWNCEELKYYLWWMQNIPGKDNVLMSSGEKVRNWWDFLADFDSALRLGKSLTLPLPTATPTPQPSPTASPSPTPTQTPIPNPTMTVASINMSYTANGKNRNLTTKVSVVEEGSGLPVSSATVTLNLKLPSGKISSFANLTNSTGIATFTLKSKEIGLYSAAVANVTKNGFIYHSVNTTQTLNVK